VREALQEPNAGCFHCNSGDLCFGQPLRQLSQLLRHGAEDAFLPRAGSVGTVDDQARGDGLFVDIQTATVAMHSHGASPLPLAKTPALEESPFRTLRMEVSLRCSYGVQPNLLRGFNHTIAFTELDRQWRIHCVLAGHHFHASL
jgi:hypothetical protein